MNANVSLRASNPTVFRALVFKDWIKKDQSIHHNAFRLRKATQNDPEETYISVGLNLDGARAGLAQEIYGFGEMLIAGIQSCPECSLEVRDVAIAGKAGIFGMPLPSQNNPNLALATAKYLASLAHFQP